MDQQSVQLVIWLGIAVLALGWASLQIWRMRRALNQVRLGLPVPQRSGVISTPMEPTGSVLAQ